MTDFINTTYSWGSGSPALTQFSKVSSLSMSGQKHEFQMEMTCEGCSGAAKRVLTKLGVENIEIDMEKQRVYVTSDLPSEQLLETLKKTGKTVSYVGTA